jgi:hypothetical protein
MPRVGVLLLLLWCPAAASAQEAFEAAGSRALGMAGAFVGVADDATAVYWNPAGLASGPPGGITIGWVDFRSGSQSAASAPGPTHRRSKFVSLGTWPLGLSYGQFREGALTAGPDDETRFSVLNVSQYGATLVQTLLPGLVVGSTLKYVRGSVVSGLAAGGTARDALAAAADIEGDAEGRFDLDLGVMVDLRRARIGVTMRNVRQPTFSDAAGTAIPLERQTRLGVAVLPADGLTLALDVDLDTVDLRDGARRHLAFGGEQRIGGRWAVRGGTRWSLEGSRRPVVAAGLSVSLRPGVWLDGHYTHGRVDEADRGFGAALRAGF